MSGRRQRGVACDQALDVSGRIEAAAAAIDPVKGARLRALFEQIRWE
jgi:hypothetical protein